MRDKEIVGLYQAYLDVYSNSNEEVEQLDESGLSQDTIRSAAKKRLRRVDADYREDTPEGDERGDKGMKKLDRTKRQLKINEPREVRMRANEEVENWVNSLIEEGYDLSEYTWDDMYEMYVTEGPNYDRNRQRAAQRAAARNAARKEGKTGNVPGVGYVSSRPERETYRDSAGVERHTSGAKMPKKEDQKESFDLFDAILEHLVAEGYADTNESALAIMANMSEEWRQSIVEAAADQSDKQIEKGVKTTYKAQNVLDNQHQGRSKGLNKLPRGEREEKAKRMRGRLETRRSDLFGERNKREDESRAELKKKYGL